MTEEQMDEEIMKDKPITYFRKNHLQKAWKIVGENSNHEE
jgi:hypothetical protein